MRPVIIGQRPNGYPYSVNPSAGYYLTWIFNSAKIWKVFGKNNPTVQQCLDKVTIIAKVKSKQIKPPPNDYDDIKNCNQLIGDHISGDTGNSGYKNAASFLVQAVGPFCSYCESPMSGNVDVEHVAPKTWYPIYSVDWGNFLLACTACNSSKSSTPSRVWVVANLLNNKQPQNEAGYITAIKDYAVWPHLGNGPSYLALQPEILGFNSKKKWIALPYPYRPGQSVQSVDYGTRVVTAQIFDSKGNLGPAPVAASLQAREVQKLNNQTVTTQAMANQSIKLCQLNRTNQLSIYDRRVLNRTLAWFQALQQLGTLLQVANNKQAFDVVWGLTLQLAAATGFYSVWLKVLIESQANVNKQPLWQKFINDSNQQRLFPGTFTGWTTTLKAV